MDELVKRLRAFPTDEGTDVHATFDLIEEAASALENLSVAMAHIHSIQQDQVMQYDEKLDQIGKICRAVSASSAQEQK
jgi:hypothetical protein